MTTFDEQTVNRDTDGKFGEKPNSAPDVSILDIVHGASTFDSERLARHAGAEFSDPQEALRYAAELGITHSPRAVISNELEHVITSGLEATFEDEPVLFVPADGWTTDYRDIIAHDGSSLRLLSVDPDGYIESHGVDGESHSLALLDPTHEGDECIARAVFIASALEVQLANGETTYEEALVTAVETGARVNGSRPGLTAEHRDRIRPVLDSIFPEEPILFVPDKDAVSGAYLDVIARSEDGTAWQFTFTEDGDLFNSFSLNNRRPGDN